MDRRRFLTVGGLTLAALAWVRAAAAKPPPWAHNHPPTTTSSSTMTETTTPTTITPTTILPSTAGDLYWSPPAGWQNFQTVNVPTTGGTINLTAGQDYRLIMPSTYVNKRPRIVGGRHVVIIGGEVNIDTDWTAVTTPDDNNGLWFDSQTGTIHVEGVWLHGAFINDGVKGSAGAAVWQVEQCRIDELQGTQAGYHCDCFQPFGGFTELHIDKVTGYSQFQGLMFKADANRWLTTIIKRLNFGQYSVPDSTARTVNLITGGPNPDGNPYVEGPVHLGVDFYLQPRTTALSSSIAPAAWFQFSGSGSTEVAQPDPSGWVGTNPGLQIDGMIQEGLPAGGDYVPAPSSGGNVGIGYVPVGYRNP